MNDIVFIRGAGGLGRPLAGEDHISGFTAFTKNADLPAGFDALDRIKLVRSMSEVLDLGITAQSTDIAILDLYYNLFTAFEANKGLEAYVGIFELTGTETLATDLSKILDVQRFAEGKIRQMGVLNTNIAFAVGQIAIIQTACTTLEAEHKPMSVVYSADFSDLELANVPDIRALTGKKISVAIGADGAGLGASILEADGFSPATVGLAIGTLSSAKVHENIAWVGRFPVSNNSLNEFDVPAFATGELFKNVPPNVVESLNTKGYMFLIKHIGMAGTFFNDTHTAVALTSDYAYIENNRTIDKAVRNCRTYLLPYLNAPLYVNADGTLTEPTIAVYKNTASQALEEMQRNGEISAFEVIINPLQNVLSTSKLAITIKVVPVGVARNIEVNIGYAVRIG